MTASKLFEDDRVVLRGEWRPNGFHVYVHHKVAGSEIQPRGYWLGHNSLIWSLPVTPDLSSVDKG